MSTLRSVSTSASPTSSKLSLPERMVNGLATCIERGSAPLRFMIWTPKWKIYDFMNNTGYLNHAAAVLQSLITWVSLLRGYSHSSTYTQVRL